MELVKNLLDKNDMSYIIMAMTRGQTDLNDIDSATIIMSMASEEDMEVKVVNKFEVVSSLSGLKSFDNTDKQHVALLEKCVGSFTMVVASSVAKALHISLRSSSTTSKGYLVYKDKVLAVLRKNILNWFQIPVADDKVFQHIYKTIKTITITIQTITITIKTITITTLTITTNSTINYSRMVPSPSPIARTRSRGRMSRNTSRNRCQCRSSRCRSRSRSRAPTSREAVSWR